MPLERLKPRFLEKVWGSPHLAPWFPDSAANIGEVWLEASSPLPVPLPVLVKFVFTSQKLSVQVHPGDEYARRHHNSPGKTEMWHVLAAQPGARIAAGFREPLSRERLREAALSGEIADLLEWYPAASGDTFFIPAGTVHAIGPGLVLCEIQQPSDITYRLYDYGRPRELHLEHALAVSRREPHAARREPQGNQLLSCEYFTVAKHSHQGRVPGELLVVIEGAGVIAGEPVRAGDAWYTPLPGPPVEIGGDLTVIAVSVRRDS